VQNDPHYIDTEGNIDGATQMIYYVDTETVTPSGFDYTANLGEGNFREFSVTRMLWDAIDGVAGSTVDPAADSQFGFQDTVGNDFIEIWASLTKATNGYRDPSFAFRNVGLLHLSQQLLSGGSHQDWTGIRGLNRHDGNTSHYGQALIPSGTAAGGGGSCAGGGAAPAITPTGSSTAYYFTLTPENDGASLSHSNLFVNNRFYHLKIGSAPFAAAGTHTLTMQYEDDNHAGNLADLDLYLYNKSARFGVLTDIIAKSTQNPGVVTAAQTETIVASLPAGDYLINVNAYTGSVTGTAADFNLLLDGVVLCPYDLVH
jgi:hypothetical protein